MIINDKNNFVPIVVKLLKGLGYANVKETGEQSKNIDITAEKDGEKYCFKCRYDIDAIGEKAIDELEKASSGYDKAVFVTNSSFLSSAKKKGEAAGILLWDRNTVDRLTISVSENLEDKVEVVRHHRAVFIVIAVILILAAAAAAYWFYFRK